MSADESLTFSAAAAATDDDVNVDIIVRNTKMGCVPRKSLHTFRYWQALETSGDNATIDKLDMTPCIDATSGNGMAADVQLWIRHLQQPSIEISDAEKLHLHDMYDYLMYQGCSLYPRSLWISATFQGVDAPPVGVNDIKVYAGNVSEFIEFLRGNPRTCQRLMRIQCRNVPISAEHLPMLLSTTPRLVELDLSDNQIGPAEAAALAESPNLLNLTSLDLSVNQIGDAGAAALAQSPNLRNLTSGSI
jgi:Leucine-rich repeat (LRR) protein